MTNSKKLSNHPKVSCWDKWVRLFPTLRLLFSKAQNSSNITSNHRSVEKMIDEYILGKYFRRERRILNQTHSAMLKGGTM